jgi:glycosyltransferase involved in cell wall biosynthesis
MAARRVAFFTDSFHETNGVALTSRQFVAHAQRRSIPLFSVHAGAHPGPVADGSVVTLEFERGSVRWNLERDLAVDFLALRHWKRLMKGLEKFRPEVIHITGPGDAGVLGALAAWKLGAPLAASWHTNLHEYAGRRVARLLPFANETVERLVLNQCVRFYGFARAIFAPNPELVSLLAARTGRPAYPMSRGVDAALFHPARRRRRDREFIIGYVGRLSPEKNVCMLGEVERHLRAMGFRDYRFLIVGDGAERAWLQSNLRNAEFPGILRGEPLAAAYASMDAFVFPSSTDTFGNVVTEALASGVPPIVTDQGGPQFLFENEKAGFVCHDAQEFAGAILELQRDPARHSSMRLAARQTALGYSWDAVFDRVHEVYASL